MLGRTTIVGLVLLSASCSDDRANLLVPFIDADGSALLFIEDGDQLTTYALDHEDSPAILHQTSGGPARATAVFFHDDLRSLRLEPGLVKPPGRTGRALPPFSEAFATDIAVDGEWEKVEELPERVRSIELPIRDTCIELESPRRPLLLEGSTALLGLARAGDAVYVLWRDANFDVRLSRTEGESLVDVELDLPLNAQAIGPGRDGRLWLGGPGARPSEVWAGTPEAGFSEVHAHALLGYPLQITPAGSDEPIDTVYVRTTANAIYRLVPEQEPELLLTSGEASRFTLLGVSDLLFTNGSKSSIQRVQGTELTVENIPNPEGYDPSLTRRRMMEQLVHVPGVGAFAGNTEGELLERGGLGWEIVAQISLTSSINGMIPFGDGVMVTSFNGHVLQYSRASGFCETSQEDASLGLNFSADMIQEAPGGFVVAGRERANSESSEILGFFVAFVGVIE